MQFTGRRCKTIKKFKVYAHMFFERADIFLLVMCLICSLFGIYMVRIATIAMEASGWVDRSKK